MALLEIQADFAQLIYVLTRIADALERAYPSPVIPAERKPVGPDKLHTLNPKELWQKEQDRKRKSQGFESLDPPII